MDRLTLSYNSLTSLNILQHQMEDFILNPSVYENDGKDNLTLTSEVTHFCYIIFVTNLEIFDKVQVVCCDMFGQSENKPLFALT